MQTRALSALLIEYVTWRKNTDSYLLALEEALLVTVGDVQGESQHPRSVLHALNEIIQSPPAGPLHTHTQV